ncbi:ankyrin repeat domain-containing protein [Winogradskyella sp.]|jgi:ankyrin repeat protein|uniref:ankyrin repeat domain-containing protein n=1 Tax=Winogradskyella sp. TaxID=1883156 RepID=UPI0025DF6F09|nr:ankyrin repeat domain-containing protein [Winogradskyella sp.]MCT4628625.1 ankyrin repeat domain-containing protein [Winogradskyella sp.]
MKTYFFKIIALLFCFTTSVFAQESNIFHDRSFWKQNPSIDIIKKHIKEGHNATTLNRNAFDAVSWALIEKVDNEIVKYLLSIKGNDVNKLTHDGRTYIFWAAYKDNLEMMEYLVGKGAKTDIIDSHGYSVLNFAAVTGQTNTKLYDFLIRHGANPITEKNHDGANALLLVAPFLKDENLVSYLVSFEVDLKSTDNNGNGIFSYAAKGGNIKILDWLIEQGVPYKNLNKKGGNAIMLASQGTRRKKNTLSTYEYLERKGLTVNIIGDEGRNPLHSIAYDVEDLNIFKFFLKKGVDINKQDENGRSPFMNAAYYNNIEVVEFLSSYVKDFNTKDKDDRTALSMAVSRNSIEVVKFLIEKGAKVNLVDKEGNSLMYYLLNTFKAKNPEAFKTKLEILTKAGLDVTKTQGKGKTLLHLAIEKNNLQLLKRVSEFKIDVNAKNKDGLTPLHLAAMKSKNEEMLKYLISIGADKAIKTDFEETVYDLAKENELLQKHKIDINFLK